MRPTNTADRIPAVAPAPVQGLPLHTRSLTVSLRKTADDRWLARWYETQPKTKDRFLVTLPARLTRQKGHEEFVAIIGMLLGRLEIFTLLVLITPTFWRH